MLLIMDEIHRKVCANLVIGPKTYPIYVGVNTIGRNKNAIVTIKNLNVSQHQALIVVIDETQHFISDLMSSNGTSMNTIKLAPFNLYQLKDSAAIVFGDLKATYTMVTSHSTTADTSEMNLTCAASQTQTQNFFALTTQLIEHRQSHHTLSYMSQETEGYINELETQEADYPLNITEKIANATPVHDYIFLKPKDRDNKQQVCTVKTKMASGTADYQPVPVESLDVETELIVQNEGSDKQTDTENTEILSEGLLEDNYHNAPTQAITDAIQTCDQQKENPLTSNSSLLTDIPVKSIVPEDPKKSCNASLGKITPDDPSDVSIQSIASEDHKESCNTSLGKITPDDPSDVPIQSIASEDPKENSSVVFNLQATNKELESSHIESEKNVTAASTIPQNIFPLSRKSSALSDIILCDESTTNISHTSTSSEIGEQFVDDSIVHTNSDNSNGSIDFMKLSDDVFSMNMFVTSRKKSKMSKLKSDSVSRVISDSDSDDCGSIKKTKTIEKLNSDSDSQMENTQEIGYKRKSLKKLNSDNSEPENSGSETDCEDDLRNVENSKCKNSVGNELDDSECIPATQDLFIDTQPVHSKINPTCENVDNKALDGKELLISDGQQVKTTNHSSEESFKLGISEYIDETDQEVNQIMSANANLESQKVNKNKIDKTDPGQIDKIDKGQEKEPVDKEMLHSSQSALNKLTNFLIPSQNFNEELYAIGTQRLTQNECIPKRLPVESQNDDIYLMSTQPLKPAGESTQVETTKKYCCKRKAGILNASINTLLGPVQRAGDDVTTKEIDGSGNKDENKSVSKENDDVFIRPTQCISTTSFENQCEPLRDDCFVMPSQPLATQRSDNTSNDHKGVDEYLHDLKNNKSQTDDQKKSSTSVNEHFNTSTDILFEDLDANQDHIENHFVIPPQPLPPRVSGMSKTLVSGSPRKSPKNTSGESNAETLSQIDRFVKQSCSKPKPDVTNDDFIESFEETLSQINTFIKHNFVPKESNSDGLKDIGKGLSEMPNETEVTKHGAIEIDDIKKSLGINNIESKGKVSLSNSLYDEVPIFSSTLIDNSETLSQIEEFVKTTIDDKVNADKGETSKIPPRSTRSKNIPKISSSVTKTTRNYKRKSPIKEASEDLSESSDDDFMNSSNRKKGKRDEVKHDINQTYIQMLESKNTKIKKSNRNPTIIDKLKVTAGSNRRSMSIAESTFVGVSTRNSKRIISAVSNTKLLPKDTCDISKLRPGRKVKRQVPSSPEVSIVQAKQSLEAPTASDETSELMTSENERSDHSVPPKKRKYTKKTEIKELNKTTEASTSVGQPRKKSSHDTDDQLDETSTTRNRTRNQSVTSNCSSTERSKRKQKPKIVFTMLDDPQLESLIRQMGGSIVDIVDKCTVLITDQVKRSLKLLQAIGQGKAICSPAWLHASKREHDFLDPWDYILVDEYAESKWKFSLKESLKRASRNKLLGNYRFQIITTTAIDVLKGAIEVCGGKCVTKCPADRDGYFFVIASPDQKSKYARMIKQHPDIQIIEPEAIFDGVLRQEIQFHRHLLQ